MCCRRVRGILKGVSAGAGTVVTKNVPEYGLAAGNLARIIKYILAENDTDLF